MVAIRKRVEVGFTRSCLFFQLDRFRQAVLSRLRDVAPCVPAFQPRTETTLKDSPQDVVQLQDVLFPDLDKVLRPKVLRELLASRHVIWR